jgi:hypothetical protein
MPSIFQRCAAKRTSRGKNFVCKSKRVSFSDFKVSCRGNQPDFAANLAKKIKICGNEFRVFDFVTKLLRRLASRWICACADVKMVASGEIELTLFFANSVEKVLKISVKYR